MELTFDQLVYGKVYTVKTIDNEVMKFEYIGCAENINKHDIVLISDDKCVNGEVVFLMADDRVFTIDK